MRAMKLLIAVTFIVALTVSASAKTIIAQNDCAGYSPSMGISLGTDTLYGHGDYVIAQTFVATSTATVGSIDATVSKWAATTVPIQFEIRSVYDSGMNGWQPNFGVAALSTGTLLASDPQWSDWSTAWRNVAMTPCELQQGQRYAIVATAHEIPWNTYVWMVYNTPDYLDCTELEGFPSTGVLAQQPGRDVPFRVWRVPDVLPNRPPTLNNPGDQVMNEEETLSFQLVGSDPDLPAQTLTYSLMSGPAGMTVSSDGALEWTPTEAQGPSDPTVTVEVSDGELTASATFNVLVNEVNEEPTLDVSSAPATGMVGSPVSFTATATDPDIPPAKTLTFSLIGAPAGASIDPTSGAFAWTPTAAGSYTFNVTVTDDGGLSDTKTVSLDVSGLEISMADVVRNGKTFTVTARVNNPTSITAQNVTVDAASLGGINTNSTLPLLFGSIKPGVSKQVKLQFKAVPSGDQPLIIHGTCSLGAFFTEQTLKMQ